MKFERRVFRNEEVALDGNEYVGCVFIGCELTYGGGPKPEILGCRMLGGRLGFEGAAYNTVMMLRAMSHPASGFQEAVSEQFAGLFQLRVEALGGDQAVSAKASK